MAKNVKLLFVDLNSGDIDVEYRDDDGTAITVRRRLSKNNDHSAWTQSEILNELATHWPELDLAAERKKQIGAGPFAEAFKMIGLSQDVTALQNASRAI